MISYYSISYYITFIILYQASVDIPVLVSQETHVLEYFF